MIPQIKEINFGPGTDASYATLHQATVTLEEMGERTISTQVRIDGDVVPDFTGWALEFRGERFVLPTLKPQASKDNSTRNSLVDLTFTSFVAYDLKRYFFAEMSEIENGTMIIDKYVSSLRLSLPNFVAAFNRVLAYYFPDGNYIMNLNPSYQSSSEVKEFPIDYMYIWDVLLKIHEIYDVSWTIATNSQGVTIIRVGYTPDAIDGHIFEYGFDGGLLRFERHVEDTDIYNVLLGRGGEKNLPYRYFKKTDPYNTIWAADPDAIPELKTVYFSRLLDSNFRNYVQGWKTNRRRILEEGDSIETYDAIRGRTDWAYAKGHTDTKFDPVEYVKDDESIAIYGVRQGKLDDNDDIFPTIQGVFLDNQGRADEVVAVEVTAEDGAEAIYDMVTHLPDVMSGDIVSRYYQDRIISSDTFTVPEGRVGQLVYSWFEDDASNGDAPTGIIRVADSKVFAKSGNNEYGVSLIPPGTYSYGADIIVELYDSTAPSIIGKYGISDVTLHATPTDGVSNRQIFTIWVKNIWESSQGANESDIEYAHRVWDPILGDKLGNSASVSFSDGWMAVSSDYEFLIQKLPEVDRTKRITTTDENGKTISVVSEWKISLVRSDAEYETTGLYIPNTSTGGLPVAGDHFFFTGIDLPIQYVKWAEKKLTATKEDALEENAWTNPTWVIGLDKIKAQEINESYASSLADRLDAGVLVNISDKRFTSGKVLTLGVRSVTFTWNEPSSGNPNIIPEIEVVLSDKIEREVSYENVKADVNYITRNYTTASTVKKIVKSQKSETAVGIGENILYFGTIIGTVTE